MIENYITETDVLDEAKENFLVYAEEVLTDRAIPSVEDGLLSSQRKILWTMEDPLKMNSKGKTKKSQSIVGSTLSTSYFHGDAACYGVLSKMAQNYLMRYPLIDGQGNLGTQADNSMVSAPRYTEARPSVYTDLMMNDFKKDVVPLKETYNNEYMEPVILPSLFPNAICNGRQAIGISMAHNSMCHNLTEACNAIIKYLEQGSLTIDELLEIMPGPDFPLPQTVINKDDVREAYRTGRSKTSLKLRGEYKIEGNKIIFTTIPYRTYRNKITEQFEKNIDAFDEIFSDFNDESSLGQNRLIFTLKNGISADRAVKMLFELTDLQTTVSYNMNFIVNGTPKLCSMLDLIKYYIEHQEQVLINATKFDREKAVKRAHILEGLIAAVDKIDEVIALIKQSESRAEASQGLIKLLSIDDVQAKAILDMKLGNLTRIDKQELVNELEEKRAFIAECDKILSDKSLRDRMLIERVTKLRDTYGDARRTQLLQLAPESKTKKEVPVKEPEDVVVLISNTGAVKRVARKSFKVQKRNTVGVKTNGDIIAYSCSTNTVDSLLVFTTKGKMYRLLVEKIPEGSNTSTGVLLSNLIDFSEDEVPIAYTTVNGDTANSYLFFATKNGIVKKVPIEEYTNTKRSGILAIAFKEGDSLASVTLINQEEMLLVTKNSMIIKFATAGMPISSRIAQGVKGISLGEDDEVLTAIPLKNITNETNIVLVSSSGKGKQTKISEFTLQNRGGKGVICDKEKIVGACLVNSNDNILINGNKTSIVVSANDIPLLSRSSIGNILLKNNDKAISIAKI